MRPSVAVQRMLSLRLEMVRAFVHDVRVDEPEETGIGSLWAAEGSIVLMVDEIQMLLQLFPVRRSSVSLLPQETLGTDPR